MQRTIIEPRFSETDGVGHIGNTVLPVWFEHARKPIFDAITKNLTSQTWPTIIAHISVDYLQQIFLETKVEIDVGVSKIGTKSFTVYHEAWQNGVKVAKGNAVVVWFDYASRSTVAIPDSEREKLKRFLIPEGQLKT